jgi:hypothetical protein
MLSKQYNYLFLLFTFLSLSVDLSGQMTIDGTTLYGNEWIDYTQDYVKLSVLQDGMHKITFQELNGGGVFSGTPPPDGANFQLFYMGKEIPIEVSNSGTFGTNDFINFYGQKNDGNLDQHLYLENDYVLNPKNSLFTDTSAYFLTWNTATNNERFNYVPYDGSNLPSSENYCFKTVTNAYFNKWAKGKRHQGNNNYRYADYDIAEGFSATHVVSQTVNLSTPGAYTSGPNSEIISRFLVEGGTHDIAIDVNGVTHLTDNFSDWSVKQYSIDYNGSSMSNTTTVIIKGTTANTGKIGVAFVEARYPHNFDFENQISFVFELAGNANANKYLEITNFSHGGTAPILYDLTNNLKIETSLSGSTVKCNLPPSTSTRKLVLVNSSNFQSIVNAVPRTFIDYAAQGAEYLIISNERLFDDGNGIDYVEDYRAYRSEPQGGNFNAQVAEVNQLYDQYAYGINRHEMAIKNFVETQIEFGNLEYLFLVGDGRRFSDMHNTWLPDFFVPTFGHPTSDHLFATNRGEYVPKVPVGRLAAQTGEQVKDYLNKVQEYEENLSRSQTIEERAWMKKIVHLGGGDAGIQTTIKNDLNELKGIIESSTFGGEVTSFFKTSTDVIQETPTDQIQALINGGVSMITFFGHSAPATLDFDLDIPSNYNNTNGKYPIVYAIGCHTSRMFELNGTLAEQWVLIKGKGAVAYLGATWETQLPNLSAYADDFYLNYGTDEYGRRIGDVINATISDFSLSSNSFTQNQLKQVMILHGDPALKLNQFEGPDYIVDGTKVATNPSLINTQMDSFDLSIDAANIGSAVSDSFLIRIDHELPDGTVIPSTDLVTVSPGFSDQYNLTIPVPDKDILGFNKLRITLDALDSIPELPNPTGEMNNSYEHNFYVVANDAFPVYPYDFSIVNTPNITLKASTANAFAEKQKYYIEIDTTNYFNSPQKREIILEQGGGLLSWAPQIAFTDNTSYYWRVSIDSTLTTGFGFNWHESSFIYNENSSLGWNQSHYHQLKDKNDLSGLDLEEPNRVFKFKEKVNELKVITGPIDATNSALMTAVLNGGLVQVYWGCLPAGIHVSVFDPITMEPWSNPSGGDYDSYTCQNISFGSFAYKTSSLEEREKLINFLDVIPDDHYVALYSYQHNSTNPAQYEYFYPDWALDSVSNSFQKNIFQVLEEQGATKIRKLEDKGSVPYFFIYQKGNTDFSSEQNYSNEIIADSILTSIEGTTYINIPGTKGTLTSAKIGPAISWQSLQWDMEFFDAASDKVALKLYGIDDQNNSFLLHDNISVTDTSLTHIDAEQYPYLQLAFEIKDSIDLTAPDLNYWRILYDPAPDAALRPDLNLAFHADTIQQGETLTLDMAVENITTVDMDSLLVHYTVIDQNNTAVLTDTRMAPLVKGTTLTAHLEFDTRAISTPYNQLLVEVNPNDDQPEQYHFNNVGVLPFYLIRDNRNPLLDVTFDGVHILDGDIVSAKPMINVALLDENPHLPLADTSLFRIQILYPEETVPRLISISDPNVTFIPAEEGNLDKSNKARIEIRNTFEVDGVYELSVDAKDATGNAAGTYDYVTHFEVINKAMVSNVFNYPNPFSTRTQFVFTLTGADIPDFMKIQIMTVSGKVVREITQDELGPLHVGKNMTDYRWDGTDEYGDRLGNGVYLYRVVTRKLGGELYDDFDTKTDQYFKEGIGKMVIMR